MFVWSVCALSPIPLIDPQATSLISQRTGSNKGLSAELSLIRCVGRAGEDAELAEDLDHDFELHCTVW